MEELMSTVSDQQRPRSRVRRLVKEELRNLSSPIISASASAPQLNSERQLVRRAIQEELQAQLASSTLGFGCSTSEEASRSMRASRSERKNSAAAAAAAAVPLKTLGPSPQVPSVLTKEMTLEPHPLTLKKMRNRTPYGGFVCDAPGWQVGTSTLPILPSKALHMSTRLWASLNPEYEGIPMVSDARGHYTDPMQKGPQVRLFMNPKDSFIEYRNEIYKPGNQIIMRKGGGSMASSKR